MITAESSSASCRACRGGRSNSDGTQLPRNEADTRLLPNQDGPPPPETTRPADALDLGWPTIGCRAQGPSGPARAATRDAARTRPATSRTRHASCEARGAVAQIGTVVRRHPACSRCIQSPISSGDPFFGPNGSPSPHRRGGQPLGVHPRCAGSRDPLRPRGQPRLPPPRSGLESSLPRPRPSYAARSAPCPRVCAAQLSEAPSRAARCRPSQFRALVRRLGARAAASRDLLSGRPASNLARHRGLATRGRPHHLPRSAPPASASPNLIRQ